MYKGKLVSLEPMSRDLLERWRTWVNDAEIAAKLDRVLPVTEVEHSAFYEAAIVNNPHAVWFALHTAHDPNYVGNVWLWNVDHRHRNAEVRILIGERTAWGSGLGTEAIGLVTSFAHDSMGLHKVYAYVMERNPAARRAFEKCGYTLEAELRDERFHDGRFAASYRLAHFAP